MLLHQVSLPYLPDTGHYNADVEACLGILVYTAVLFLLEGLDRIGQGMQNYPFPQPVRPCHVQTSYERMGLR